MKTLIGVILIIVFGFLAQFYLPWWTIVPICFLIGFAINDKWWSAIISGFLGVGLLWIFMSIFQTIGNQHVLATRMSELLGTPNRVVLLLACSLLGALLGSLGAITGYSLRFISAKPKRKSKYS